MQRNVKLSSFGSENLERLVALLNERADATRTGNHWQPDEAVGVAIARWVETLEEHRKFWQADSVNQSMPA